MREMPRSRVKLGVLWAISESTIVKVLVGEEADVWVHAVLDA